VIAKDTSSELIASKKAFQEALLGWYSVHKRDLPWRTEPTLYKTVLSEFMLQQTQIKTALPYFHRWLKELPDFEALAKATPEKVLKLWEGLGYYTRCRNIHRLAKALVSLDKIPQTVEAWLELPGVGPYTAAAITSISFHVPQACVDGNVVRIISRLTATDKEFTDSATASKYFNSLAQDLINSKNPGDHNQAMMELGATLCSRTNPQCLLCPVKKFCKASEENPEAYPRFTAKKIEKKEVVRLWCIKDNKILLHKIRASAKRLSGIHELPSLEESKLSKDSLVKSHFIKSKVRTITRFQITEAIYRHTWTTKTLPADFVWVPLDKISTITLSGPHKRWIVELLKQ